MTDVYSLINRAYSNLSIHMHAAYIKLQTKNLQPSSHKLQYIWLSSSKAKIFQIFLCIYIYIYIYEVYLISTTSLKIGQFQWEQPCSNLAAHLAKDIYIYMSSILALGWKWKWKWKWRTPCMYKSRFLLTINRNFPSEMVGFSGTYWSETRCAKTFIFTS
jgi:hypothetical protein